MRRRLGTVDIVSGVDPVFIGLHSVAITDDGRAYKATAHCAWPAGQTTLLRPDRRSTVVLPTEETPGVILHELAHVLDERIGWNREDLRPVSRYAENTYEDFACGLVAWLAPEWPEGHGWGDAEAVLGDEYAMALFAELAA